MARFGERHWAHLWPWVLLLCCCGCHLVSVGFSYTLRGYLCDPCCDGGANGLVRVPRLQPSTLYRAALTSLPLRQIRAFESGGVRGSSGRYSSYQLKSSTCLWNEGVMEEGHISKQSSHDVHQSGFSTGTRKRSRARVSLVRGTGLLWVNKRRGEEYMQGNPYWLLNCRAPLLEVQADSAYDIYAEVKGGGLGGQSGAIMLAVARELSRQLPETHYALRQAGFLTVDSRKVERKKFGFKKARKRPQYSKR